MGFDFLAKKARKQIFDLFSVHSKLKFNQIARALGLRSNMVAYHLECMQKDGVIEKKGLFYSLTCSAERQIPVFSRGASVQSPLPIVLVAVMHKRKIVLLKRTKRPYMDYWGLIGGKLRFDETIFEAVKRLVREKTACDCSNVSLNSVLHERVIDSGVIKHSFVLFFAKVEIDACLLQNKGYGSLKCFSLKELKKADVIPSDLWLIKNKLSFRIKIPTLNLFECDDKLTNFKFVDA